MWDSSRIDRYTPDVEVPQHISYAVGLENTKKTLPFNYVSNPDISKKNIADILIFTNNWLRINISILVAEMSIQDIDWF